MLVFVEEDGRTLNPVCLQMLTLARELAANMNAPLEAVLIGPSVFDAHERLRGWGLSRIHRVQHPRLEEYAPDAWAAGMVQLMKAAEPRALLAAGTERGSELLARVGARTGLPLATNCVQVMPGECFRVLRQRWGSSLLEEAALLGNPRLVTIAPHVVNAVGVETRGEIPVQVFTPTLDEKDLRVRVVAREESQAEGIHLKTASVVIGGGRGVGSQEGFRILEELAGLLGGAIGGSRVATNNGWRPHSDQIGLTGNRIAPDLYIACGISGAIQHLVGCKGAKRVMVINRDPDAPFFRRADYGVVGDLHEILPAVIDALRKRTGRAG